MKSSRIRGYLKDLENKNIDFSHENIMKIFDISNYVFTDIIDNFKYSDITDYKKSKFFFKEIAKELKYIYELLSSGEVLMSICLLRNVYEEILYVMATSLDFEFDINVKTTAGYFKEIVSNHICELCSENIESADIADIYSHLSKLVHVTNLKEAVSYLVSNNKLKAYLSYEIKYILLFVEHIYLDFLHKKCNLDCSMCRNILIVSGFSELVNALYFVGNLNNCDKILNQYFYGKKNQKYLNESRDKLLEEFKSFNSYNNYDTYLKRISKELDEQLYANGYVDIVNKFLRSDIDDRN